MFFEIKYIYGAGTGGVWEGAGAVQHVPIVSRSEKNCHTLIIISSFEPNKSITYYSNYGSYPCISYSTGTDGVLQYAQNSIHY